MKYSIFYLIKGKAKRYRNKLVKRVGPKFGEKYVLNSKYPAHITLKVPFETKNISKIEKLLERISKENKKGEIKIFGFGNFKRFVAFLKIKPDFQTKKIQKEIIKELSKLKKFEISKQDKKWVPHSTISYGNTKESFDGIWKELMNLKKILFNLEFDNLTIMKKDRKFWKVHKKFKLK